jgi:hypothetical protein
MECRAKHGHGVHGSAVHSPRLKSARGHPFLAERVASPRSIV